MIGLNGLPIAIPALATLLHAKYIGPGQSGLQACINSVAVCLTIGPSIGTSYIPCGFKHSPDPPQYVLGSGQGYLELPVHMIWRRCSGLALKNTYDGLSDWTYLCWAGGGCMRPSFSLQQPSWCISTYSRWRTQEIFLLGTTMQIFLMGQYLATYGVSLGPCAKGGSARLDWTGDTLGYKKIIYILAT